MNGTCFDEANLLNVCQESIDYQGIVKHINDGVFILREGNIIFTNDAFCEIVGRDMTNLRGRPFADLVIPEDRDRVTRHCVDKLYTSDLADRIEFSIARPDEDAIVEMKLTVVDCGGAPAILAAITDITERRKTRIELQRVKDRLESILHAMNDVVVSLSPTDQSILAINPAAEALYGIPRRAFSAGEMQLMHFVHPEDREEVGRFYRSLEDDEFGEMQYRIISSNGRIKWVHDEGQLVYCTIRSIRRLDHVIRDITDQKEALDALTRSEEKYRDFFQSTKDMAYSVASDGSFLDINEAGIQMLGFASREEALASNLKDFYENLSERADLLAKINEDGYVTDKHVRFRLKDGKSIEVAITARAKTDDSGYLLYYEGIAHNITQAMEDQRNRVLRNAAGGMCHYLNTHLMHILNAKDGIEEDIASLDGAARDLPVEVRAAWTNAGSSLRSYCEDLDLAYRKITAVTKAFNSAFLTYKEESYLDKAILDIFNSCLGDPRKCSTLPSPLGRKDEIK
ncbi:MAG: PAS domain-containing protein [Desulfomicrobium sp.]|nr:PAS domain-containing protein [Desulfomicrobium sp.]MDP3430628.1 PAS domain-containing protein [Desulfomicrobium sp.]